jgi:TonB family protein
MKKILFVFLVIISQNLISQIRIIKFEMWKVQHEKIKKGKIIEDIVKRNDSCYTIRQFTKDSIPVFRLNIKFKGRDTIKDGKYISFYMNKKIRCTGQYSNNIPYGVWNYFKINGEKDTFINYSSINNIDFSRNDDTYQIVEEEAKFMGGDLNEFGKYLKNHLIYPDYALQRGIGEKLIVQFCINQNGEIINPKLLRSANSDLEFEVYRVFSETPKWTPPKMNGKNVVQQFVMPIIFEIK